MLCALCKGNQNLFFVQKQIDHSTKRKWITCPNCSGTGVINPIFPAAIKIHMNAKSESNVKIIKVSELPENATMANIAVLLEIFPSLTQARKNGFDRPITLGKHTLTKRKIEVEIIS